MGIVESWSKILRHGVYLEPKRNFLRMTSRCHGSVPPLGRGNIKVIVLTRKPRPVGGELHSEPLAHCLLSEAKNLFLSLRVDSAKNLFQHDPTFQHPIIPFSISFFRLGVQAFIYSIKKGRKEILKSSFLKKEKGSFESTSRKKQGNGLLQPVSSSLRL